MPYLRRTTIAGKTIEIECYYSARYNKKGAKRSDKVKATKEAQKRINRKKTERKLRLILNENFKSGDYYITLDYIHKKGEEYRTPAEMRKDINIFLRECRKICKKLGIPFKYIHVMEIGKRGARHHHLVINKIDTDILQKAWNKAYAGHNRIKVFPLDSSGQYGKLAAYLIKYSYEHLKDKDRLKGKSWSGSQNLKKPIEVYEVINDRNWFRCEAKQRKGYYVEKDSIEKGIASPEYFGYGYFRYRMVKLE